MYLELFLGQEGKMVEPFIVGSVRLWIVSVDLLQVSFEDVEPIDVFMLVELDSQFVFPLVKECFLSLVWVDVEKEPTCDCQKNQE